MSSVRSRAPPVPESGARVVQIGDTFSNPVTGERFDFRATSASTGGEYCEFDLHVAAGAPPVGAHRHPVQRKTFSVVTGTLHLVVDGQPRVLAIGEEAVVPQDTSHTWSIPSDAPAQVRIRMTPPKQVEDYVQALCRIAADGGAAKSGLPKNPLQLAVLTDAHRDEFALPSKAAQAVAAPVVRLLAVIGRRAGFRPDGSRAR